MQVYFETNTLGEEILIGASLVGPYYQCETNLKVYVISPDKTLTAIYDYIDDVDEIDRIREQALDEISSNRYGD